MGEPRFPFSPFPTGWYAVAFSNDLGEGDVRPIQFAGHEAVLFRTESGVAAVVDAFCPHMGAHLGHGGRVVGESIRCPMHAFRFDTSGRCVATGYGTRPSPKCRTASYAVLEQSGVVLVHHDEQGGAPTWTPPAVDLSDWGTLRTHTFPRLPSHPQETTENSVDIGHLGAVHGYENVHTIEPLRTEGAYLTTRYGMSRRSLVPGTPRVRSEFRIHVHGLGHSHVEVDIGSHGMESLHFVFATPVDGEHIDLRIAMAIRSKRPVPRAVAKALDRTVGPVAFRGYVADVTQDFAVWTNKRYVHPPVLAEGDGPVGKYRKWARQFYATSSAAD